jgi:hypothetical protein
MRIGMGGALPRRWRPAPTRPTWTSTRSSAATGNGAPCPGSDQRCWQLGAKNPIISIHDVGAGGLSNAFPEITNDAKRGAIFDLRKIPLEESGMAPKEIWSNESQERYVLAIAPENLELFKAMCERERCLFAVVAWPPKSAS